MKLTNFLSRGGSAAALAMGLLGAASPRALATSHTVNIVGDSFSPASLTINVGDSVSWSGLAGEHNVTGQSAGDLDQFCGSGGFGTETSCSHTFTTAGTFPYECTIHFSCCGMAGTITVNGSQPPPTPTVSITSPANNATFTAPASVQITADASVSSGTVTNVTFFSNGSAIGSATSSPFQVTVSGLAAGTYNLTAVATAAGVSATSSVVMITVNAVQPPPTPTVSITSPANNATFTAPASVQITADASVSSGTVTNVTFFSNGSAIGSATSSPFQVTASGLAAGTYNLTAVATAAGVSATSSVVMITVNAVQPPPTPTVSITSPTNGATFTAPASVQITADASVSSGTVTNVTFFSNGSAIGSATSAPFQVTASGLAAGSYDLTAVATAAGISATSEVVTVNVANTAPAPTVDITSPQGGAVFAAPGSFQITADASVSSGSVTNVSFFANSTLVGSATSAPFSATTSGLQAGPYVLTAVATAGGISTTSAPVTVEVATSTQAVISGEAVSGGQFSFSYTASPGLNYLVQRSSDLVTWTTLSTNNVASSPASFSDTFQPGASFYYRVVQQ